MRPILKYNSTNTPAIQTAAGTAIAANENRVGYRIQNLSDTNPLFVREGGTASTTVFNYILAPGAATDDGEGGSFVSDVPVCIGEISVAGTSPRFVATEFLLTE